MTWSLASLTTPDGFPDEDRVDALCRVVSDALRACTPQGTDLLLLDWQHLCYSVDPHRAAASVWSNAFIPDPDPAFVIAPDFSYGVFGQASDDTLLVFGQALVDRTMPQLNPVLGEPVGKDA
ncbi:protein of unknown function (plasmid) [Streptantibioticus cattleyicolor NRRL 8057 = DSM 46488]|nr:protein of unknown function [Streptantibioticus cattleyicolor NRRL 8057 = DSM 46488]